jgi:hypothetical protein
MSAASPSHSPSQKLGSEQVPKTGESCRPSVYGAPIYPEADAHASSHYHRKQNRLSPHEVLVMDGSGATHLFGHFRTGWSFIWIAEK